MLFIAFLFNQFLWWKAILFIHYTFNNFIDGLMLCLVVFWRTFIWFVDLKRTGACFLRVKRIIVW
ncbi:Uncharacterised protein [Klebsiella michiganensis]|uniref:Uncharacterized protein n=1 Tax=Klebsiella michiganensis TaxID=1134687 RepID=A0A7H4PP74_9ENTR|nr:hypothetical protein CSC12_2065 [Klebsiella michiganensis]STW80197.1 Uncharacterised protein [Klebsiella michiganensis]